MKFYIMPSGDKYAVTGAALIAFAVDKEKRRVAEYVFERI